MDWSVPLRHADMFWHAAQITVLTGFLGYGIGLAVSFIISTILTSPFAPLRMVGRVYVEVVRNTPLLLQVFAVYFITPSLQLNISPLWAGIIALAIHASGYLAEGLRGGVLAIGKGQREAGVTLGMTNLSIWRRIVAPQMIRYAFPVLTNQLLLAVLGSSLLSAIAVNDTLGTALLISARTFTPFSLLLVAWFIYLVVAVLAVSIMAIVSLISFREQRIVGIATVKRYLLPSAVRPV
jgi:His/Glu/Gln/Arg/opine family amino acid ABC transporter permease subunit